MKQIRCIIDSNLPGKQPDEKMLQQVREYFTKPQTPRNINPNDVESEINKIQKGFNTMCNRLQQETSRDIRTYNLREYFSLVEMVEKQTKPPKKKI